ncbi:MAG: hypothetical protein PHP92_04060 [Candidatus Nanoarchaeia archaeon]|nr:hypothetical protein [Candidatus Nanoarchaeia archaeon]
MEKKLKAIYSKFLNKDKPSEKKKCIARNKNCTCGYHFKKDETKCPECGKFRTICGRWAMVGKNVCRTHGGKAGRKMTKGVFITKSTFTKEEFDKIEKAMLEKKREHEFVYQVATAAFKKIVDNVDNNPMLIMGAATEYFSKIAKYIQDIDRYEAEMVHIYSFNEVDKVALEKKIKEITERVLKNALMIIMGIMKKELNNNDMYQRIYGQIPEPYRILLESQPIESTAIQKQPTSNTSS